MFLEREGLKMENVLYMQKDRFSKAQQGFQNALKHENGEERDAAKNNVSHQIKLQRSPDNIPRDKPTLRPSTATTTTTGNFENFQHEPYDSPFLRMNSFSFFPQQ